MKMLVLGALVLSLLLAVMAKIVLDLREMAHGLYSGNRKPHDHDGED